MNIDRIRRIMAGQESPAATLDFLANTFLPAAVRSLNEFTNRRLIALYPGDLLPTNERNLTDVRTRMGQLIEHLFSSVGNEYLASRGIADLKWTSVVAHRFPDLEIRDGRGSRGIRVDVKCIQSVAEEKAANFDTLKKDIHPSTDFIIAFLWDWSDQAPIGGWVDAPRIARAFAFHAYSLAELRDYRWLQHPPKSLGGGLQGIDLRYAVNCRSGAYNVEEGNFGKLLRIWKRGLEPPPHGDALLGTTAAAVLGFEEAAVWQGFAVVAARALGTLDRGEPASISVAGHLAGYRAGKVGLLLKRRAGTGQQREIAAQLRLEWLVTMGDKYDWVLYRVAAGQLQKVDRGRKPKHLSLDRIAN